MKKNAKIICGLLLVITVLLFPSCLSKPSSGMDELDRAIRDASDRLNEKVPKGNTILILNIQSESETLSNYIIDGLTGNVVNDGYFSIVVARDQLDELRNEQQYQTSGEVDDNQAVSIGKFLSVQTIVTGEIKPLGGGYRLSIRAIDVQTSEVQGHFARTIDSGRTITMLIRSDAQSANAQPAKSAETAPVVAGGIITLNDIPSMYNGKYALASMGDGKSLYLSGAETYIPDSEQDVTGVLISNGNVKLPVWLWDDDNLKLTRYTGSDTWDIYIEIFNSSSCDDSALAGIAFEKQTFTNGSITLSARSILPSLDTALQTAANEISNQVKAGQRVIVENINSPSAGLSNYVINNLKSNLTNGGKVILADQPRFAEVTISGSLNITGNNCSLRISVLDENTGVMIMSWSTNINPNDSSLWF